MAIVIPKEGRIEFMQIIKDQQATLAVGLYKNNYSADADSEWTDLVSADYSGFEEVIPAFGAITIDVSARATMTCASIDFACDGLGSASSVYGWYLVSLGGPSPKLLASEKVWDGGKSMSLSGDTAQVTITLRDTQG